MTAAQSKNFKEFTNRNGFGSNFSNFNNNKKNNYNIGLFTAYLQGSCSSVNDVKEAITDRQSLKIH